MKKDEKHNELQGGRGGHPSGVQGQKFCANCAILGMVLTGAIPNVCIELQKNTEIETFLV